MKTWAKFPGVLLLPAAVLSLALWASPQGRGKWVAPDAAKKVKNPVPVTEEGLAAARGLFLENCAQCHGEKGKGDGPEAAMYGVKPADLTNAQAMGKLTDGEIFYKISEGREPMPPFKKLLSEEERWQLVNLLRTLAPRSSDSADKPNSQNYPKSLIVLPSGADVKYASVGGRTQLVYRVYVDYPAERALKTISEKLRREGWKALERDFWNPSIPSSHMRGWVQFEDRTTNPTTTVNEWMAQWENRQRDIVSYTLEYRWPADSNPDLNSLRVVAIFIPAPIATKEPRTISK
ncbi:MAG TPA: cytochrome c [Candidatus Acidoferrales bacterium]